MVIFEGQALKVCFGGFPESLKFVKTLKFLHKAILTGPPPGGWRAPWAELTPGVILATSGFRDFGDVSESMGEMDSRRSTI